MQEVIGIMRLLFEESGITHHIVHIVDQDKSNQSLCYPEIYLALVMQGKTSQSL